MAPFTMDYAMPPGDEGVHHPRRDSCHDNDNIAPGRYKGQGMLSFCQGIRRVVSLHLVTDLRHETPGPHLLDRRHPDRDTDRHRHPQVQGEGDRFRRAHDDKGVEDRRQLIGASFTAPDPVNQPELLRTRRASRQLAEDRPAAHIDGHTGDGRRRLGAK